MNNKEQIQIAFDMYKHEHTRWNQWAVFFLGSIASIFIIAQNKIISEVVAPYIITTIATLTSLIWVIAAFAIKQTTSSWRKTILELESTTESDAKIMVLFDKNYDKSAFEKGFRFRSVTNMLILLGLISFLFFLAISFILFCKTYCICA